MILVKKNDKIGHIGVFLPMFYGRNYHTWQGGLLCLTNRMPRTATTNLPISPYRFLPAPIRNVLTSTNSTPAIFQLRNGWAKTKQSGGYTVKPVAAALVNGRVHLCNTPSCRKKMWYVLSNVSGMAVLSKLQQISARLMPVPYSVYWKKQASEKGRCGFQKPVESLYAEQSTLP